MLTLTVNATATIDGTALTAMIAAQREIEMKKLDLVEKSIEGVVASFGALMVVKNEEAKVRQLREETSRTEAETRRLEQETHLLHARVRLLETEARMEDAKLATAAHIAAAYAHSS